MSAQTSVLVVEDDGILALYLEELLNRQGYRVLTPVPSGEQAVLVARAEKPSIIIMDIELSGEMNGIAAAQQITAENDIPIIFLTGYSQDPLLQQAKIAAPYGYLVKPAPEREMVAAIEIALYKHKMDRRLKESEARYRSLIEQATDGIFLAAPNETILEVNTAACAMLGYTLEELIGRSLREFVVTDNRGEPQNSLPALTTLQGFRIERTLRRKDGGCISTEISGKRLGNGNVQGIVRDITERKEAEALLRLQSSALNAAANAIVITDSSGDIRWVNPAFSALTGYSAAEAIGKNQLELSISGLHNEAFYQKMLDTIHSGGVWRGEITNRRKDGSLYHEEITITPLLNPEGEISQFIAIRQDISERKQAETIRRQLEEKFSKAFHTSPDSININRLSDGMYIDVNQGFTAMTGYTAEEIIGKTSTELNIWASRQDRERLLQGLREKGEVNNLEASFRFKSGEIITGLMSARVIEINDEPCILSITRDISQRKRAEQEIKTAHAELQQALAEAEKSRRALLSVVEDQKLAEEQVRTLNTELERRVAERTAQLEAANKELESFSYSVSHDLRGPLRALNGFSTALLEDYADKLDAEGQDYLTRIREAANRMDQLINDLLQLSRISRKDYSGRMVDLSALARAIAAEIAAQEPEREMAFDIAGDITVWGDENLLRIALENLLNNASKFTSKRDKAVIQFGRLEQGGKPVYFVRDNGAGFDMSFANRLFAPFQRLHAPKEFPGTGIGLVTVQRIIARHGGRIWPEAEPDKGATFYFTLPDSG